MPKRKRCGHCNELLTNPVYKKHKDLFYDRKNRQWNRKMKSSAPELDELDYEDDMIFSGFTVCYLIAMMQSKFLIYKTAVHWLHVYIVSILMLVG